MFNGYSYDHEDDNAKYVSVSRFLAQKLAEKFLSTEISMFNHDDFQLLATSSIRSKKQLHKLPW